MSKIHEIKAGIDIVKVVQESIPLKRTGTAYKGKCPFHQDKTASLTVYPKTQRFKCFGCDASGDVVDFVSKYKNVDTKAAIAHLDTGSLLEQYKPKPETTAPTSENLTFVSPAPKPPATIRHPRLGTPSQVWPYVSAESELLFYVCRFELPGGGKEVLPYTPWRNEKNRITWRFMGVPSPRSLYGLDRLREGTTAALFEGEKTADAAQELFPHIDCLTWQGGSKAIKKTDFSPLHGRRVLIFPDADEAGILAARELYALLSPHCPKIKAVHPITTKKGWDVADWEGTGEEAILWSRANVCEVSELVIPVFPDPEPEQEAEPERFPEPAYVDDIPETKPTQNQPYRSLGFDNGESGQSYWFFTDQTQSVLSFRSPQLGNEHSIKEIAPANFWEGLYQQRGGKINTSQIAERLRNECAEIGTFSPERIRGRGAWDDAGKLIIHAGDHLVVEGRTLPINEFHSYNLYPVRPSLGLDMPAALTPKESARLQEICELFRWERKINSTLLAGWCVIAPFCGVLNWRPHLWLVGGAGTGKSWILQNVVRPILGRFCLALQSSTTEAAIRQQLSGDALPVILDEFEAENEAEQARTQNVLTLVRATSSADGGGMAKGSAGGKATIYKVRSCFLFASIAQSVTQESDKQRITTLSLMPSTPEEKESNKKQVVETITAEFAARLQSRVIENIDTLKKNIVTFSVATAKVLGDTRAGDQLGAMLAGAYLLKRGDVVTPEFAESWVRGQDWAEETPKSENRDENRLLQAILERVVVVDGKTSTTRTIGELIYIAQGGVDALISPDAAVDKLLRFGINAKPNGFYVSLTSGEMRRTILKGTTWSVTYPRVIIRVDGAKVQDNIRFSPGVTARAVFIPYNLHQHGNQ